MAVFVLDKHHKPLMPCSEKRARQLLERGRARVHKMNPFTIRIVDRLLKDSVVTGVEIKIDPGSKETGIAVIRSDDMEVHNAKHFICLEHRGELIKKKMQQRANYRRRRRSKNLRYRAPRFSNRKKASNWLPPSIQHRVNTIVSWVKRLLTIAPVTKIYVESVKFDTQKLQNPEISGVEYQHGELFGYEVKEYLLEKWGRCCAYCGKTNVPLEVEHIVPKSHGGTDRVSNLTLACHDCNQKKADQPVCSFLQDKPDLLKRIIAQSKQPLRDAANMNATRFALLKSLKMFGLPIESASGAQTKWNRKRFNVQKEHWLDALCVGNMSGVTGLNRPVLHIKCLGRGSHQRTKIDKFGFPRGYCMSEKRVHGFGTGDIVMANVPKGKNMGQFKGRVAVRKTGFFDIQTANGKKSSISWKYCRLISRNDGYSYEIRPGVCMPSK